MDTVSVWDIFFICSGRSMSIWYLQCLHIQVTFQQKAEFDFSGLSFFEVIQKLDFIYILSSFSFLLRRVKVLIITLRATFFQTLIFG